VVFWAIFLKLKTVLYLVILTRDFFPSFDPSWQNHKVFCGFEYTHDTPGNSPDPELNTCYNSDTRPRGVPNSVVLHQYQNYQLRGNNRWPSAAKRDTGQLSSTA
jgi:hypothetical protein